jgi:hypothetical protein
MEKWRLSFRSFPRMRESTSSAGFPRTGSQDHTLCTDLELSPECNSRENSSPFPAPIAVALLDAEIDRALAILDDAFALATRIRARGTGEVPAPPMRRSTRAPRSSVE